METTATQIINYFSGFKQYLVPLFQRPYTWGEREWGTLWEDVVNFYGYASDDSKSTHFMGAVVTMPARSVPVGVAKFMIIDGQQRLTTIALMLCAIRDVLAATDNVLQRRIQNHYLTNDGYDGPDFFKLLPTQADRTAYSSIIQNSVSALTDSQFKKAYDFFCRQLKGQDDDGNPRDPKRILELVENRLMVVSITLSDGDDPYLIFESLNFKGSPLQQADLVRNYFLMQFSVTDQQTVYDELWAPMQKRLDQSLTDFMRHFLGAEGEEIRKGDVYTAIKRLTADSDPSSVRLLVKRMEQLSIFYSRISARIPEPNEHLNQFFVRFHRLDFGTAYPLLLALYEDYVDGQFSTGEFVASLRILDSYIIRRMVVGVPSNQLLGVFISLCKSKPISDNPSAWLSDALAREGRNRRWPTDAEFSERWLKAPIYTSRACQVILECLEASFEHKETVTFDEISVEHILPQTLSLAWLEVLGDQAAGIQAEWLHTIGNLTLTGYNSELGNKTYAEKSFKLAKSHFELNRFFSEYQSWGDSEIRKRAEALFAIAQQVWPRPALVPEEPPSQQVLKPANFHSECVRYAQKRLGIVLSKLSQTRYESGEQGIRVVCAVSAEHNEGGGTPFFWFAVHRNQLDFLEHAPSAWLCFGCGSAETILLIPVSVVIPLLAKMSESVRDDRKYWHVVIHRKNGKPVLRFLGAIDGPDLSEFLVPS